MLINYLLVAIRNLKRNKVFSAINILGLALGIACSLLIFLWVNDERQVDQFSKDSDRLYTVYEKQFSGGKIESLYFTPGVLADELKRKFPQLAFASGFQGDETHTFQLGDKTIKENGGFAENDFLKMFGYQVVEGDAGHALQNPSDIAISLAMAENVFGSVSNAMGNTIRYENKKDFRITAVFQVPKNASQKFDFLINWYAFLDEHPNMKSWGNHGVSTFIKMKPGANPEEVNKGIKNLLASYDTFNGDFKIEMALQRFDEMYLHSNFNTQGVPDGGRIEYVRLFSIVSLFILIIACINFMNLTTARSIKRAKEIGVRKVIGAVRSLLVSQFIGEAVLLTFFSMLIALAIVILTLPAFNALTGKEISLPFTNLYFWPAIVLLTLATGVIAGSYPALFLSSFNPVRVLKGTLKLGTNSILFRKSLVVFQFALSIVLIMGTMVVTKQVKYIQSKNLGFDRGNLLFIPQEGKFFDQYKLFKNEALKVPGVFSISRNQQMPTDISNATWGLDWTGKDPNFKPTFSYAGVGYDFTKTMNVEMVKGRDFAKNLATDSIGYILNETALKQVGYKDPIGKSFTMWGRKATIIGVVKDFHFNSLRIAVNPMVMWLGEDSHGGYILVKIQPGKTKQALAGLEKLWKSLNPGFPFTYQFADEQFNKLYASEQMVGKLSNSFAALAIFISCLGLLGLSLFTAEQRTKEISVRKVLGANAFVIFRLLSNEFLLLVLIALLIASPVAWFAMNTWLQDYAYRTDISWWIFAVAGVAAVLIAIVTISFQTLKASLANPIKSLRTE